MARRRWTEEKRITREAVTWIHLMLQDRGPMSTREIIHAPQDFVSGRDRSRRRRLFSRRRQDLYSRLVRSLAFCSFRRRRHVRRSSSVRC